MKYIDAELIKSTKGLYNDIDSCIDELLKARVGHNQENEGKALFRMEGLMVATLQQLDCIIDSFQQEQPDLPGIEESGIPGKDYIPVEWVDACEKFGKWKIVKQEQPKKSQKSCNDCPHCVDRKDQYGWHFKGCFGGPYKGKFIAEIDECPLQQEQPEVDLEKEYTNWWNSITGKINVEHIMEWYMHETARHFYELGQSTKYQQDREEFAKLKAREWINGYDEGYAKGLNARKEENK